MRVLMLTTELAGVTAHTGGIGRGYRDLVEGLAGLGLDVDVRLYPAFPCLAPSEFDLPDAVDLYVHDGSPTSPGRRILSAALDVRKFVAHRASTYDAIIAPEWEGLAGALKRPRDVPLITNLATSMAMIEQIEGADTGRPRWQRLQMRLESRQVRTSTLLVPCSPAIEDLARKTFAEPLPPTRTIPNGLDVRALVDDVVDSRAEEVPHREGKEVLFVGRVERRKGVEVLAAAWAQLMEVRTDLHLTVIGRDRVDPGGTSYADTVFGPLRSRAPESVALLGDQPRDVVLRRMARADVIVLPSLWEAFGNVAIEAMAVAHGAILATSGSGFSYVCEHGRNAVLVPPGDVEALRDAINRLVTDDGLRRRLSDHARSDAWRYDVGAVAELWRDAAVSVRRPGRGVGV